MTAVAVMREHVLSALDCVVDPELDEPITTLRFVEAVQISADGDVEVLLRLPTPQCAPNFAFLMAADARDAVRRVPGVNTVRVRLNDHYTEREINGALERSEGFAGAFPGETHDDDLHELRMRFVQKALVARQGRMCEALLARGVADTQLLEMRVGDLPDSPETDRLLQLRSQLSVPSGSDAPAFVLPSGEPLVAGEFRRWLRVARLVLTSLEVNGGICRSLLAARYGETDGAAERPE